MDDAENIIELYQRHAQAWGGGAVLDLGCGAGRPMAAALVERGCRVTGVDSSPAMVALFRQHLPAQEAMVADMRTLSLRGRPHHDRGQQRDHGAGDGRLRTRWRGQGHAVHRHHRGAHAAGCERLHRYQIRPTERPDLYLGWPDQQRIAPGQSRHRSVAGHAAAAGSDWSGRVAVTVGMGRYGGDTVVAVGVHHVTRRNLVISGGVATSPNGGRVAWRADSSFKF